MHPLAFNIALCRQSVPIPSYLLALAVGRLESRPLGPISAVWSEPEMVEAGAHEFAGEAHLTSLRVLCCVSAAVPGPSAGCEMESRRSIVHLARPLPAQLVQRQPSSWRPPKRLRAPTCGEQAATSQGYLSGLPQAAAAVGWQSCARRVLSSQVLRAIARRVICLRCQAMRAASKPLHIFLPNSPPPSNAGGATTCCCCPPPSPVSTRVPARFWLCPTVQRPYGSIPQFAVS